jgi:two-component system LytT family response regulator
MNQRLSALTNDRTKTNRKNFLLKTQDKIFVLEPSKIILLRASGAYTTILFETGEEVLAAKPLKYFEKILAHGLFFRCHHSYLINLDKFVEYNRISRVVLLKDKKVPVSRRKLCSLLEAISHFISQNH